MEYFDDTTLEEGRIALYQLEKQLRYKDGALDASDVSAGSRQQSLQSERRMLDQVPRDTRLIHRLGSPLGHTIEELDDRGMLDGGASVPSYYTSYRQKSRRALEMKKRSSRLQERKKEGSIRHIDSIFHLMRTLQKKGVNILAKFRIFDEDRTGEISRRSFIKICRQLYLPFTTLELQEFCNRYQLFKTERIDYLSILRDCGFKNLDLNNANETEFADSNNSNGNSREYEVMSRVIVDLKKLLLDSITAIEKPIDDVYRMFAKWDTEGTGMITATQFLRVLGKLHISLSDQDQDALIELLDTNGMGRVDIDGFLTYCFVDFFPELGSPQGLSLRSLCGGSSDDSVIENTAGDTASGGSLGLDREPGMIVGAHEQDRGLLSGDLLGMERNFSSNNSTSSNDNSRRRPMTANSVRLSDSANLLPLVNGNSGTQQGTSYASNANGGANQKGFVGNADGRADRDTSAATPAMGSGPYVKLANGRQRPVTASGRVSSSQAHNRRSNMSDLALPESEIVYIEDDLHDLRPYDAENPYLENEYAQGNIHHRSSYGIPNPIPTDYLMGQNGEPYDVPDGGSFNDNTLITSEQEDYYMSSPHSHSYYQNQVGISNLHENRGTFLDSNLDNTRANLYQQQLSGSNNNLGNDAKADGHHDLSAVDAQAQRKEEELNDTEPRDHLNMLANQILTTVREMVLSRYRIGKPLHEIYRHFDRSGKNFFTAKDFVVATSDLRIEMSHRVAELAIHEIAIDSGDSVTFGEFKVYILDHDHKSLMKNVQQQIAYKLEQHGWKYVSFLQTIYFNEESHRFGGHASAYQQKDTVSSKSFVAGVEKLGVKLTVADMNRLVARFDVLGNDLCYIGRWLNAVRNNAYWKHAEKVLMDQEEAVQESRRIREYLKNNMPLTDILPVEHVSIITEEVLSMVEYLGIKPISEHHLLWIAVNALQAPLPSNWVTKTDGHGRTYFYNISKQQASWDHPLDPHFRKLRDNYRSSDRDSKAADPASIVKPITNVNLNTNANNPNQGYNYNNMGNGGAGSALNPPPLNIRLTMPRPELHQFSSSAANNAVPSTVSKSEVSGAHGTSHVNSNGGGASVNNQVRPIQGLGDEMFHVPNIANNRASNNNGSSRGNSGSKAMESDDRSPLLGPIGTYLKQMYQGEEVNAASGGNAQPVFNLNNDAILNKLHEIDQMKKSQMGRNTAAWNPSTSPYLARPSSANPSSSINSNSGYLRKKFNSISQNDYSASANNLNSSAHRQSNSNHILSYGSESGGGNKQGNYGNPKGRPSSAAGGSKRSSSTAMSAVDRLMGFTREAESGGYMSTKTNVNHGGANNFNSSSKIMLASTSAPGFSPVAGGLGEDKKKSKQLSEMFDDSLVHKLDNIILSKSSQDQLSNAAVGGGGNSSSNNHGYNRQGTQSNGGVSNKNYY